MPCFDGTMTATVSGPKLTPLGRINGGHTTQVAILHRWPHCTGGHAAQVLMVRFHTDLSAKTRVRGAMNPRDRRADWQAFASFSLTQGNDFLLTHKATPSFSFTQGNAFLLIHTRQRLPSHHTRQRLPSHSHKATPSFSSHKAAPSFSFTQGNAFLLITQGYNAKRTKPRYPPIDPLIV